MTNPAEVSDVESRWRPLSDPEKYVAEVRVEDAWRKLKRDVPDLQSRMQGDADLEADAVRVIADAVIRVLRSLERNGLRRGTVNIDDGSTSWEAEDGVRATLYFTDDELADLSATGRRRARRAFSVMPS